MTTPVAISHFSWGTLRVVQAGHHYSIVIHPRHWAMMAALADGERGSFVEETGRQWTVKRDGENFRFSSGNYRRTVPAAKLAAKGKRSRYDSFDRNGNPIKMSVPID